MSRNENQYAIYKFDLCSSPDSPSGEQHLKVANNCLASLFDEKTIDNLTKTSGRGDTTRLANDVMKEKDGVYVWRVNNSQMKAVWLCSGKDDGGRDAYDKQKVESTPYGYVLIDNRPEHCLMAIEKSTAWNSDPDRLCDVVRDNLNQLLNSRYGLNIVIEPRWNPLDVWDYVHERIRCGDYVRQVAFELRNPERYSSMPRMAMRNDLLKSMLNVVQSSKAESGTCQLDYNEKSGKEITNASVCYRDISEMVELCGKEGYDLTIKFNKAGVYRTKEKLKVFYPLTVEQLESFIVDRPVCADAPMFSEGSLKDYQFYNGKVSLKEWFDFIERETGGHGSEKETGLA